jgi:adenine-specific DNA-methyltransferase
MRTTLRELRRVVGDPFYADQGFIIYKNDCLDVLRALGRSRVRVDLTVTSPPYNIGKSYEHVRAVDDYIHWSAAWTSAVHGVTTPTGAFWLNLGYLHVPGKGRAVPIPYLLWDKIPFFFLQELVWNYGAGVTAKRSFSPRNEKWLFYVADESQYTFNLDDVRDPNVKYPNQKKNGKFRCNPLGKNPSDVWQFPKVTTGAKRSSKERTAHPAQFPLGVVERIVKVSSNLGDIVLDPFSGSASTGIAAVGTGRVYIGVEKSEEYCRMSVERVERFLSMRTEAQRQLFGDGGSQGPGGG